MLLVALALSIGNLAYAMRSLPIGTSYTAWVTIGAVLTVVYGMALDGKAVSVMRVVFLLGIVGCVAGLKALH